VYDWSANVLSRALLCVRVYLCVYVCMRVRVYEANSHTHVFLVPLPARASVRDRNDAPAMRHAGALLRSRGFLVSTDLRQPGQVDPHSAPLLWLFFWFWFLGWSRFVRHFFFPDSCKILHKKKSSTQAVENVEVEILSC